MSLWKPRPGHQGEGRASAPPEQSYLLSVRAAVIMVTSCAVGVIVGLLAETAQPHPAMAIIAGVGAGAAALKLLNGIIGPV